MNCNFFGTLNVCIALFPLLRDHARVVNVSSRRGMLDRISNIEIKRKLSNGNCTIEDLVQIANNYIMLVQALIIL